LPDALLLFLVAPLFNKLVPDRPRSAFLELKKITVTRMPVAVFEWR